ncbi:hypothetical protein MKL09_24580 [Methylobacterium sp. J-048]|uniref:hypothetical protein n=1 Tax=Methylobacterium sp. J-048 TaxID=2836635 RepID=UPI001FBA13CA|nr:hypothetical protein [Methylobacterium sp. J-048]MCJ2059705.1 hypothetical protein [Methylobacterium sp. J-048]
MKADRSQTFGSVRAFYRQHGTCSRTFCKYDSRELSNSQVEDLLPQKRGPRWAAQRMSAAFVNLQRNDDEVCWRFSIQMNPTEIQLASP